MALPTDHHDFLSTRLHALLSYPLVPGEDLRPFGSSSDTYVDGVIQEVNTAGAQVWRWNTSDHFAPNSSTFPINFADTLGLPAEFDAWDVFHLNSIDRMPDGDYVVSARHLDAVFRGHRNPGQPDDGSVSWTLGGPVGSPGQLDVVGDPDGGPKRPHDARMVGDVLTVFDNQAGMPGRQSRAVAYRIDEVARTATMLREFQQRGEPGSDLGGVCVIGS